MTPWETLGTREFLYSFNQILSPKSYLIYLRLVCVGLNLCLTRVTLLDYILDLRYSPLLDLRRGYVAPVSLGPLKLSPPTDVEAGVLLCSMISTDAPRVLYTGSEGFRE